MSSALLADVVAGVHLAIVVFVIAVPVLVLLGRALGWGWVHRPALRIAHLLVMGYIAFNAIRGEFCFLTHWEEDLRVRAGQEGSEASFIGQLLHDILFVETDPALLNGIYLAYFGLVLLTFLVVPPRRAARPAQA